MVGSQHGYCLAVKVADHQGIFNMCSRNGGGVIREAG